MLQKDKKKTTRTTRKVDFRGQAQRQGLFLQTHWERL